MRPLLLALLLIVCVNAGFSDFKDKVKDFFSGVRIGEKAKHALEKLKKVFNVTKLLHVKEKLSKVKTKLATKLLWPKEVQEALAEKLKNLISRKKDKVSPSGDTIDEINQKSGLQDVMFQGDIILTERQTDEIIADVEEEVSGNRTKRQAFVDRAYPQTTWQQGVNYFFDSSVGYALRRIFKKGADEWSKNTCIDFRENSTAQDRIRVFMEDGCWSFVGRLGGQQDLSLGEGCDAVRWAVLHCLIPDQLLKTFARTVRNSRGFAGFTWTFEDLTSLFGRFHMNKAAFCWIPHPYMPDWLDQFAKQTMATNNNYGIPYDFGGIMHYGATSATYNGQPTMVPVDTKYIETLGSPFVSFYELDMVNKHYKCHGGWEGSGYTVKWVYTKPLRFYQNAIPY
ncbi:astacin [Ancylostoma caninum]|uniref:Metalloendopeptidase n=1 Tax=Ancylostoma caninum TaxID=29170 RepID=A0A368GUK8_ANCCA|nr:astacin [Ancylostoma caninum]